jgi:CRISPR-associated protein Cmr2
VGPALHAAISEALTNFAMYVAPLIVEKHFGFLIYSGGDDLLALLPANTAFACARELRLAFSGDPAVNGDADRGYYRWKDRDLVMMGSKATASAGLAIVHYKEDLRFALNTARDAEKEAKSAGRNLLRVVSCRRSGEHAAAICPWHYVDQVQDWVETFLQGASDRWAYHLREELPTLEGLEPEAVTAEIRRQVGRTEGGHFPPDEVAEAFRAYLRMRFAVNGNQADVHRLGASANLSEKRRLFASALHDFVVLCQTASFLARGREE